MSESLVEDGSTYPTTVTVPEDGDARNAASVVVGFQALADRAAWFYTKLATLINGGALATADDAVWTIADDKSVKIESDGTGSGTGALDLTEVYTDFAGFVRGHLFSGNAAGRANKKILTLVASTAQTFNARLYDTIACTPTGNHNLTLDVDANYVSGEHVLINNHSATNSITVRDPAAAALAVLGTGSIGSPSWAEIAYNGTDWVVLRRS